MTNTYLGGLSYFMMEIIVSTVVMLGVVAGFFLLATSVRDVRIDYIEKQKANKRWDFYL